MAGRGGDRPGQYTENLITQPAVRNDDGDRRLRESQLLCRATVPGVGWVSPYPTKGEAAIHGSSLSAFRTSRIDLAIWLRSMSTRPSVSRLSQQNQALAGRPGRFCGF